MLWYLLLYTTILKSRPNISHVFPSFHVYGWVGSHLQGGNRRLRNLLTYLPSWRVLFWFHSKPWTSVFQNTWQITQVQNLVSSFWHWVVVHPTLRITNLYKRTPLGSLLRGSNHSQGRYKTTDVGYSHESREIRSAIQEFERSSTLPDIHSAASALCIITHNNDNWPHRTRKLIITKANAFTQQYPNHPRLHHYNRVPYDSSFNIYPSTCPTITCSSRLFKRQDL